LNAPTEAIKALKAAMTLPKKTFREDLEATAPKVEKTKKLKQERRDDYDRLESCDNDANCPGDYKCIRVSSKDGSETGKKCIRKRMVV